MERRTKGERIRYARREAGLSQSQLAAAINLHTGGKVTKSLISQWERDAVANPTNANLLALQHATGFSAEWLVRGRGPERVGPVKRDAAGLASIDHVRLAKAIKATGLPLPASFARTVGDLYDMLGDTPNISEEVLSRFAATLLSRA